MKTEKWIRQHYKTSFYLTRTHFTKENVRKYVHDVEFEYKQYENHNLHEYQQN